jgi:glycosyltransferase involved in cell wall biosynthesis
MVSEKIIYISPTYFSNESLLGGAERFSVELVKAMSKYADVGLISFGKYNKILPLSRNVNLYIFKRWNNNILNPFNPFFLNRLKEADIIHCHQYLLFFTKLAIIFAKTFKKKIFVTDLGMACSEPPRYFDWSRWIDKFLVISKFSEKFLEKHYAPKEVIYGGVDIDKFRPLAERKNKVLCVGRITPHKGINYLIEAIPPDIELDIVGPVFDEKYYEWLRKLAFGKKINFLHGLTDAEMAQRFASASVFVFPGVFENELFALVILEAMASGCAVIGTNVGGVPEIIIDKETGFIVPPKDHIALREKIEYLIKNPQKAKDMGKAGRMRVEEMFTWDLVAKRCLKAYGCKKEDVIQEDLS